MIKRALLAALALLSVCLPVGAAQASRLEQAEIVPLNQMSLYQPKILTAADYSSLLQRLPMLALLDEGRLPVSSELGRMGMISTDFLQVAFATVAPVQKINGSRVDGKDSPRDVTPSRVMPEFMGGEVGVFYGKSTGKFGGSEVGSYIDSTFGTDKYQITVGASYEEFNGRVPRWSR